MAKSINKKYWISIFVSTIGICIPAFINNFPFLYADTGTYIRAGFSPFVSSVRPATYGLFLKHASLHESFWLVIFIQALMTVWFINVFVKYFFPKTPPFVTTLIIVVLALFTSMGITTGMLMPDFTTPIFILATILILHLPQEKKRVLLFCSLGLWFALACHHSHCVILLLMLFVLVFKAIVFKQREILLWKKRLLLILGLIFAAYLTIPTIHYFKSGEFFSNKSSNVFLLGRFNQMGLLEPFLNKQCPTQNYPICKYKEIIPDNFLWDKKSPVLKDGGWEKNNEAYGQIVFDFFTNFHYVKKFIVKSIETGTIQFFDFNTVRLDRIYPDEWPQITIQWYLPDIAPQIQLSKQSQGTWKNDNLDLIQKIIVLASALFLIYIYFYQEKFELRPEIRKLGFLILLGLLCNAFVCGGISMIAPRFQSRVVWLLPMFALLLFYELWLKMKKNNAKTDI